MKQNDPMNGFRAPPELRQMVDAWAEANGYCFSAAVRRIITLYLRQEQQHERRAA